MGRYSILVKKESSNCAQTNVSGFEGSKPQSSISSLTLNSHSEGKIAVYRAQTWPYRMSIFNTQELGSILLQCHPNKNAKRGACDKKEMGIRKEAQQTKRET